MTQSLRQRGLGFAPWRNGVSTPLEHFFKILSRSLGAIPYRPGVGGKQNIGQDPESNQYLLTLFILIDYEQSIFIFLIILFSLL
jgi:hypothetical protein